MKWERLLLVAFFGNFIINSIVTGIVSLLPGTGGTGMASPQYITYVVLSIVTVGILAWWYFKPMRSAASEISGAVFGLGGFVIAVLTVLISSSSGVLQQTGSFSQLVSVLPNFGPYLWQWTTLVVLLYWVIPSAIVGWLIKRQGARMNTSAGMGAPMQ